MPICSASAQSLHLRSPKHSLKGTRIIGGPYPKSYQDAFMADGSQVAMDSGYVGCLILYLPRSSTSGKSQAEAFLDMTVPRLRTSLRHTKIQSLIPVFSPAFDPSKSVNLVINLDGGPIMSRFYATASRNQLNRPNSPRPCPACLLSLYGEVYTVFGTVFHIPWCRSQ